MAKHTISGFLYHIQYDFQTAEQARARFYEDGDMSGDGWALVGPHSFEVEIPDDFDPRPVKVAALEAEKQKVLAAFAKRITDLDSQINKLLALENAA